MWNPRNYLNSIIADILVDVINQAETIAFLTAATLDGIVRYASLWELRQRYINVTCCYQYGGAARLREI